MAYEQRDNSGQLFKNTRREKETHPNATGTAMIGGVTYEVSAWTKQGKNGPFQSLSFKAKQPRSEPPQESAVRDRYVHPGAHGGVELNDDLPF